MSTEILMGTMQNHFALGVRPRASRQRHGWPARALQVGAGIGIIGFAVVGAILASPLLGDALIGVATAYVVASTLDRSYLTFRSFADSRRFGNSKDRDYRIADHDLPHYTVVVVASDRPTSLSAAINPVRRIDYPADKLDVYLVVPRGCADTIAMDDLDAMNHVRILELPAPHDYASVFSHVMALPTTRGEYMTVYDSSDVPDPQQLRLAAAAFATEPTNVAALQARLLCRNPRQSLLNRWQATRYSRWFTRAAALIRNDCAVPLSESSHHIKTSLLREIDGWDPNQPSANLELAIRFARNGYRVGILDSPTERTAVSDVAAWIRQAGRTNWNALRQIARHLGEPVRFYRDLGLKTIFRMVDLSAGKPIAGAAALALWALTVVTLVRQHGDWNWSTSHPVVGVCLTLFLAANALAGAVHLAVALATRRPPRAAALPVIAIKVLRGQSAN